MTASETSTPLLASGSASVASSLLAASPERLVEIGQLLFFDVGNGLDHVQQRDLGRVLLRQFGGGPDRSTVLVGEIDRNEDLVEHGSAFELG